MKVNQIIIKESMGGVTSGAIATVESPLGSVQKRPDVKGLNPVGAKSKKKGPYKNSLSEGKMKQLSMDMGTGKDSLNDAAFKKKYGKTKEEMRKALKDKPSTEKPVKEAKLDEDDLIVLPGQKIKRKTGFVPHGQSRVDHEVEMARSDVLATMKNAKALYELLKNRSEEEGIEGWVQEKLIKANDYLNAVKEYYDEKMMQGEMSGGVIAAGGVGEGVAEGTEDDLDNLNRLIDRTDANLSRRGDPARYDDVEVDKKAKIIYWVTQETTPAQSKEFAIRFAKILKNNGYNGWTVKVVRTDYWNGKRSPWRVAKTEKDVAEGSDSLTFWKREAQKAGGAANIDWYAIGLEHSKKGIVMNPPYGVGGKAVSLYIKGLKAGEQGVAEGEPERPLDPPESLFKPKRDPDEWKRDRDKPTPNLRPSQDVIDAEKKAAQIRQAELEKTMKALARMRGEVEEGRVPQLPTRGADYSKYDTDHLEMLLRPGILHRNELRFKNLIRKELARRKQAQPVNPKDLVVPLSSVPVKKPRGSTQYDPAKEFPGVKVLQKPNVTEKAVSKAQQRFFGMAHAIQKGEKIPGASKELKSVAKGVSKKAAHDFAATKHKGLPEKVKKD